MSMEALDISVDTGLGHFTYPVQMGYFLWAMWVTGSNNIMGYWIIQFISSYFENGNRGFRARFRAFVDIRPSQ